MAKRNLTHHIVQSPCPGMRLLKGALVAFALATGFLPSLTYASGPATLPTPVAPDADWRNLFCRNYLQRSGIRGLDKVLHGHDARWESPSMGGENYWGFSTAYTWLFDPTTNIWTRMGDLNQTRWGSGCHGSRKW